MLLPGMSAVSLFKFSPDRFTHKKRDILKIRKCAFLKILIYRKVCPKIDLSYIPKYGINFSIL